MPQPIIACRTASYGPFESLACAHLASLGIRHVEIPLPAADRVADTIADLERHNLTASTLHGECDVSREDCAEQVAAQLPVLAAFGTTLLFVSCKAGDTPRATAYARLRAAGGLAAKQGVTIVLETHPDLITNADVAGETMQAVAHNNVRVNFDTANVYFYNQNTSAPAELRKIAPFVRAIHLKDTTGGYRAWNFPALGRGVVDFAEIFRIMDATGFNGPYTLEIEGIEGETPTERLVCDRIAESVGYLRGLGRMPA